MNERERFTGENPIRPMFTSPAPEKGGQVPFCLRCRVGQPTGSAVDYVP